MLPSRVLIAEDIDILRDELRDMVNEDPAFVVVGMAATGAEAQAFCERTQVDIVLMDIEMERMNAGIKAAEKILASHPQVKIIFLTAHETETTVLTAMATGAVDYIVKGCDAQHLHQHLHGAVDGTTTLDPMINNIVFNEYRRLRRSEQSLLFFIQNLGNLTPTEKELVKYIQRGMKVKDIAAIRFVEPSTVKTQIHGLLVKFGCKRTQEVVRLISDLGISHLFAD